MDKVKEYKGSFGEAFRAAEKAGDKQFRWYNPKSKQIEIFAVKHKDPNAKSVNTYKPSNQQTQAQKNKQLLTKKKIDSEGDYYDAGNLGELTVTATRTKLKGNEQGFIPITSRTDLVNFEGKPRLYQNYTTGEYFVVDNYGNIIGKSTDSNVEKIGFNQFRKADGSLTDLKERGAVELTAQANRNEANQLSQQDKDRKTDDRERQLAGIRRMQGMANTVQGWMNLPNHAITGGLKLMRGDYNLNDYKQGFTMDGIWRGEQEIGAGDLFEIQNPYGRFAANLVNPMTLMSVRGGTGKKTTKGNSIKTHANTHNADAHIVTTNEGKALDPTRMQFRYVGTSQPSLRGKYVGTVEGNGRMLPLSGNKSSQFSNIGRNQQVTTHGSGPARIHSNKTIRAEYPGITVQRQSVYTTPRTGTTSFTIPGIETTTYNPWINGTPYNFAFRYDPETQVKTKSKLNPRQYEYAPGIPNPWIEKGYANPWNSDKPYTPRKPNNGRVNVTNSHGFNTPLYSGETIGSGGFNSEQYPQLKTF